MSMHSRILSVLFLMALAPAIAHAGLAVEADVVVSDEAGGTLTLVTSASHEIAGSNVLTTAEFDNFRPNPDGRALDGEIVRGRVRDVESVESTFDGSLTISGPGDDESATLLLQDVTVHRDGQGPEFSGTVVYNDEAFDASDLPARLAIPLRRVLRLFHFA